MFQAFDRILEDVEQRRLGRREAVTRLAAVALAMTGVGSLVQAKGSSSTFEARGLNHIALRVGDVGRSRDFYRKHLGMTVLSESKTNCFLACGPDHFVALFEGEPAMDHYCYTVDDYDASTVVGKLEAAGLKPRRTSNRVYFDDPDGLEVQLASARGSRPD
jgi:catechol-2,3-dioxygenase